MPSDPSKAGKIGGSRNTPAQQAARKKNGFQRKPGEVLLTKAEAQKIHGSLQAAGSTATFDELYETAEAPAPTPRRIVVVPAPSNHKPKPAPLPFNELETA